MLQSHAKTGQRAGATRLRAVARRSATVSHYGRFTRDAGSQAVETRFHLRSDALISPTSAAARQKAARISVQQHKHPSATHTPARPPARPHAQVRSRKVDAHKSKTTPSKVAAITQHGDIRRSDSQVVPPHKTGSCSRPFPCRHLNSVIIIALDTTPRGATYNVRLSHSTPVSLPTRPSPHTRSHAHTRAHTRTHTAASLDAQSEF
jgi:hypothetical protein